MASWEGKKYKLEKSENFDEYMKALGVGLVLRKLGNTVSPTCELSKDGDSYTFATISTVKSKTFSFKVGEEFDDETADGRKVKTVLTFENDNKLVQVEKGDITTTIVREFTDTEMIATMTLGDLKCVRYYKAL